MKWVLALVCVGIPCAALAQGSNPVETITTPAGVTIVAEYGLLNGGYYRAFSCEGYFDTPHGPAIGSWMPDRASALYVGSGLSSLTDPQRTELQAGMRMCHRVYMSRN